MGRSHRRPRILAPESYLLGGGLKRRFSNRRAEDARRGAGLMMRTGARSSVLYRSSGSGPACPPGPLRKIHFRNSSRTSIAPTNGNRNSQRSPDDRISERGIYKYQHERHLTRHSPQDQSIIEEPSREYGPKGAAAQEHIDNLQHNNGAQARCSGAQVQQIIGSLVSLARTSG
jgi:hypothetical protein